MTAAKKAQTASEPAAIDSASGSQNETPYSCAAISRPAPTASGSPRTRPTMTRLRAPRRTSHAARIAVADAVQARRIGHRQRAQHDRVDEREDRRGAADAERQREHGRP